MNSLTLDIVGSGKVAWQLARQFMQQGVNLRYLACRRPHDFDAAARHLGIETISIEALPSDDHPIILAVSDDAIAEVGKLIPRERKTAHTSGTVAMNVLPNHIHGVFYPLQTFSDTSDPNWKEIPICIEANTSEFQDELLQLAQTISDSVHLINSEQRKQLHVAAVVVNNFTNHLFHQSKDYLDEHGISFDLLKPLIKETVQKLDRLTPKEAQTGPAVRNDRNTINSHLELLENHPDLKEIYALISQSITNTYER